MSWMTLENGVARPVTRLLEITMSLALGGLVGACGLLDVSDPTALEEADVENGTSAELLRRDAVNALSKAIGEGALESGVLADEFFSDPDPRLTTPWREHVLDQRVSDQSAASSSGASTYGLLQAARFAAIAARPRVVNYTPEPARAAYTGQVLAVRGYATLRIAEVFCPGFPLNDVVDGKLVYGPPMTTAEAFESALADFDAAVQAAADSVRFLHLAQVGRARTLLGLGRFAEAGTAAQPVPDDFVWHAEFASWQPNPLVFSYTTAGSRLSVSDKEGGNGLDFRLADDPRVATSELGPSYDGTIPILAIGKYPTAETPVALASGIEARLIEAEAALHTGGDWLGILNALRTDATQTDGVWNPGSGGVASLAPLADPMSEAARVDLLFRERAFWLFATGSRLADLRRLIEHYGRAQESVFPSGAYRIGGSYGTATSVPFPAETESAENPAITGCTRR